MQNKAGVAPQEKQRQTLRLWQPRKRFANALAKPVKCQLSRADSSRLLTTNCPFSVVANH